jgi:hypothetical protein
MNSQKAALRRKLIIAIPLRFQIDRLPAGLLAWMEL